MMNNPIGEAPAYTGQANPTMGAEHGGHQAQHQQGHGAHGAHGGHGQAMPNGYPAYYCAPTPPAPAYWEQAPIPTHPAGAMPPHAYAHPPAYAPPPYTAPQPAPQMAGYPHPGYLPIPQHPPMSQPHPAYGYAPAQPHPYPAQTQAHDSGLSSFFNFRDERFIKGAVTGAALTFILTNESLQKNTLKSVIKFWNMLQGGVEEMKERIQDIDAEIKAEDQKS